MFRQPIDSMCMNHHVIKCPQNGQVYKTIALNLSLGLRVRTYKFEHIQRKKKSHRHNRVIFSFQVHQLQEEDAVLISY